MLELGQVSRAESISLGNDRNQIDTRAKSLHDFDVKRLEGVAGGTDKVQARMDTKINLILAARLLLLKHVRFVLVVEKFDNGHPGVAVVDIVTESGCVNDGQADYNYFPPPERLAMAILELREVVLGGGGGFFLFFFFITLEELLLELSLGDLNFDGLVHLLLMSTLVVGIVLNGGREECVDKGGFSKARFASNLNAKTHQPFTQS